jgi:hypothetical protein
LKKRSKKLLCPWLRVLEPAHRKEQKFFGSFFQKRTFLNQYDEVTCYSLAARYHANRLREGTRIAPA